MNVKQVVDRSAKTHTLSKIFCFQRRTLLVSLKWQSQESTRLLKEYLNEKQDKTKQNKKSFKVRDEDDELD
jgi:hypothetical protein